MIYRLVSETDKKLIIDTEGIEEPGVECVHVTITDIKTTIKFEDGREIAFAHTTPDPNLVCNNLSHEIHIVKE